MSENAPSAPAHSKKRHQPALFAAFGAVFLIVALGAYWWWSPQPEGLMSRPRLDAQSAERLQLERIDQANRALQKDIESLRNTGTGTIDVCPPGTAQRSPQGALMLPEGGPLLPGPAAVTPKSGELRQEPNASTAGPDVVAPTPDAPATASKSADGARKSPDSPSKPNDEINRSPDGGGKPAEDTKKSADGRAKLPGATSAVLSNSELVDKLEKATAIVLSSRGTGTGFFINDKLMITNRHVVEGTTDNTVVVASRALGMKRQGTVLRMTGDAVPGNPDFALIRLDEGSAPGYLELSTHSDKLSPIVAAGYPSLAISDDPNYRRLRRGDGTAAPDLNLTQGIVQSRRDEQNGIPLILHTATILPGNSGGPLVDICGRVVGVNTYFTSDKEKLGKLSHALGVGALLNFLQAAGGKTRDDVRGCG